MSTDERHQRAAREAARTAPTNPGGPVGPPRCTSKLGHDRCGLDAGHRGNHYDGENVWGVRSHNGGMHTPESAARAFRPTQLERERAHREATAAAVASTWHRLDAEQCVVLRVWAPELGAALDALGEANRA